MKSATDAPEPMIWSAATLINDDLVAAGKFVDEFDTQREIDRISGIFTKARALVDEVLVGRAHRTQDGS